MAEDVYSVWVNRLSAFGDDPNTSLAGLPEITVDYFPASTFERLMKHINRAENKVMERWDSELSRDIRHASDTHELSNAILHSRKLLARRIALDNHPSLPEVLRSKLMKNATDDINNLQKDLEKNVGKSTDSWAVNSSDQLLEIVRTSPLTAVLSENYQNNDAIMQVINQAEQYSQQPDLSEEEDNNANNGGSKGFFGRLFGK
ncbi:hypothetical protein HXT52_00155 [Gardnerella sp. KA00288]|uniref:hypothetical protein n=1 Tax=unclassified Gardnerella TaxID=2628112 RepID=UPI0039705EF9